MRNVLISLYIVFSFIFFVYLAWPYSAGDIGYFSALPDSVKSKLSGDTTENPDIKAYFSGEYRNFVIPYYIIEFKNGSRFPINPLRLNYQPEEAFTWVKDQTQSTYLEEITYPLRDSLFINGLEPFDMTTKEKRYKAATIFVQDGKEFETKVTLRYYKTSFIYRMIVWMGIEVTLVLLYIVGKRTISK